MKQKNTSAMKQKKYECNEAKKKYECNEANIYTNAMKQKNTSAMKQKSTSAMKQKNTSAMKQIYIQVQ